MGRAVATTSAGAIANRCARTTEATCTRDGAASLAGLVCLLATNLASAGRGITAGPRSFGHTCPLGPAGPAVRRRTEARNAGAASSGSGSGTEARRPPVPCTGPPLPPSTGGASRVTAFSRATPASTPGLSLVGQSKNEETSSDE